MNTALFALLLVLWGGLVGFFFSYKSVFHPKSILIILVLNFLVFTPIVAIIDLSVGFLTWFVASALTLKWSETNIEESEIESFKS